MPIRPILASPRDATGGRSFPGLLAFASGGGLLFAISLAYFLYSFQVRYAVPAPAGAWLPPAAADILLFSAFAMHHSLFARTPFKAWVRRRSPPVLERAIYTWIASLIFIWVCWSWQPVPGVLYRLEAPWRWLGYAAQAAGIAFTVLGSRALDVLDLAGVRPVLRARTGAEPAHVPLSTSGVFAIVRHPLYFGWTLVVCGAPDMTATRAVFALVSSAYVAIAITWEERALVETFGARYEAYRRRVRWKMIPGLY
jgi:protein-S-isoprenylcysteine O-methyltransferase Ste14